MFKLAAVLGFTLLAITGLPTASVRSTYKAVIDSRINSAIDEMKNFIEDSRRVLVKYSVADQTGVYAYANALKENTMDIYSSAYATIQDIAANAPEQYKVKECNVYIDNLSSLFNGVEDELDSCTVPVVVSAAFDLSKAVQSVSDAIAELENLKSETERCADSECAEISNTTAKIVEKNLQEMNAARKRYRSALHNIAEFKQCVRTLTRYHQFTEAASTVAMATVKCVSESTEAPSQE